MENFDFISDNRLKIILERDYKELIKCFEAECYKSVLILSGSLIEAIVVEFFLNKLPVGYSEKKILSLQLHELLDLAFETKLVDERTKSLSTIIKNYRNLIHPGREVRLNEQFDKETANVSVSLVKMVLKEIKTNYLQLYGYSAKDIVNKISNDSVSIGIFEELIKKLNYQETHKLMLKLVELELSTDFTQIDNIKQFVDILKAFIKKEDLLHQLNNLHKKVETGEKKEILKLLNLFKEELDLLETIKKDLIIKYAISVLNSLRRLSEIEDIRMSRVFSGFAKYIEDSNCKNDYKMMFCHYHSAREEYTIINSFYYQLVYGLSPITRKEFDEYSTANVVLFTRFEDDTDHLPF